LRRSERPEAADLRFRDSPLPAGCTQDPNLPLLFPAADGVGVDTEESGRADNPSRPVAADHVLKRSAYMPAFSVAVLAAAARQGAHA